MWTLSPTTWGPWAATGGTRVATIEPKARARRSHGSRPRARGSVATDLGFECCGAEFILVSRTVDPRPALAPERDAWLS
jgi:hypothetical protein